MRYSDRPFPPYTYIPGQTAHPRSDPAGHSYGRPDPHVAAFESENWRASQEYLFGIDLFNAQFFWESHEQWEALWHAVGRRGDVAEFLKGLIKLAAANVKRLEGNSAGVRRHATRAEQLFDKLLMSQSSMAGFELAKLRSLGTRLGTDQTALGGKDITLGLQW